MPRSSSSYGVSSYSFGPGPLSPALKYLIGANVGVFVLQTALGLVSAAYDTRFLWFFGLRPEDVVGGLRIWQLATYMFLHGGLLHILFNMLALWMFGVELEHRWGTRNFLKFYFVTGIGAAVLTVIVSFLPFEFAASLRGSIIVGASGAIYGLLLAYGLYFPDRQVLLYFLFPIRAKYFVMIMGAIALYASVTDAGGVANVTHLGGLLVAYAYLRSGTIHPISELKYRYLKWKINRVRKKFDVYSGGRADDWDRRVH
jgi:membrane associated rhomboid family serine protease